MASVLDGIRVLDLSWGIAGPIAGMLLADHGADVIKVEPPGGDPFRRGPGYDVWLRGRRSVVLDLKQAGDRDRFLALVDDADIVLDAFSPGTMAGLGLDAGTLLARNPRVIVCSITAYGPHAAHRDRPGYDALVAARLGILDVQRGHDGGAVPHMHGEPPFLPDLEIPDGMDPGPARPGPIFTYTPWLSMGAAFLATTGINAALLARERTGRGQHVQTSLLQAALSGTASKWQRVGRPDAVGYRSWVYDRRAPKGFFRCADGRWVQQWVPHPRFAISSAEGETLAVRRDVKTVRNDPERIGPDPESIVILAHYFPEMAEAFSRFPSDQWTAVAAAAGVPLQPVRTPEEALADPVLLAEGAVADVDHPEHGTLRQAGILYGLSRTPGQVGRPVPRVGEHTGELLTTEVSRDAPSRPASAAPTLPPAGRPPLDGITVLDIGFAVAGPWGTQVLADLGANVIKVNAWRDPWWHAQHIAYGANRGKRSIGIDLKSPGGQAVFRRLVATADVVHSNMRRDALQRLSCDEASLREVNPQVIYCHTRGFDRGPRSDSPGNDQTGCSLAGVTWEDGGCWDGGRPFWSLTSLGDTGNGFFSAIGVIQALYHRARTGEAQGVDTSILNAGLLVASMAAVKADGTPLPRPRLDRGQLGLGPLYRLYQASDGWGCLAAVTEPHRKGLAAATGIDVNALDAAHLEPWFRARTGPEAFAALEAHGVPFELCDGDFGLRVFDDPEMDAHELVVHQQHPKLGSFEHFGKTIHFSDTPERIWGPPPVCGQHTREIMREHGFGDAEIDALAQDQAVFEEHWVELPIPTGGRASRPRSGGAAMRFNEQGERLGEEPPLLREVLAGSGLIGKGLHHDVAERHAAQRVEEQQPHRAPPDAGARQDLALQPVQFRVSRLADARHGLSRLPGRSRVMRQVEQDLREDQVVRRAVVLQQDVHVVPDPLGDRLPRDLGSRHDVVQPSCPLLQYRQHQRLTGTEVILDRSPANPRLLRYGIRARPVVPEIQYASDGGVDNSLSRGAIPARPRSVRRSSSRVFRPWAGTPLVYSLTCIHTMIIVIAIPRLCDVLDHVISGPRREP